MEPDGFGPTAASAYTEDSAKVRVRINRATLG
jgi:hypothetical protein